MYETFDHTADLGLRVAADDLPSLMVEAARGLTAMLLDDPSTIQPRETATFTVAGGEPDYLLLDWLNELLFHYDTTGWVGVEFEVVLADEQLRATVKGESVDLQRHGLAHEVKAITYHQLSVKETPTGWTGELIVDI